MHIEVRCTRRELPFPHFPYLIFSRTAMPPTTLLSPYSMHNLALANRAVMAPMTRSRAVDANTPNALMAEYYGQRAGAGAGWKSAHAKV